MSQNGFFCRWCTANFCDVTSLSDHEQIYRYLDFLNGNTEGSPVVKKRRLVRDKIQENGQNYFCDSMLDELLEFEPDRTQIGMGPSPPASTAVRPRRVCRSRGQVTRRVRPIQAQVTPQTLRCRDPAMLQTTTMTGPWTTISDRWARGLLGTELWTDTTG